MSTSTANPPRWHDGVTRYQWLVLVIACLGWIFDAFEGQLYNITRGEMLPDLLRAANPGIGTAELAAATSACARSRASSSIAAITRSVSSPFDAMNAFTASAFKPSAPTTIES